MEVNCGKGGFQMNNYLPFIYEPEKSIAVFKKTEDFFKKNPDIKRKIKELGCVYDSIGNTVPQTTENFWSGHLFPYTESWDELQISFNLVIFGFYKQAFMSLRSGLELGLLSVYYNINDDGHHEVQSWLKSKDSWEADTPRTKKIWQILNSNTNIATFNKELNIRERYNKLSFLHNYVHTKGYKYSNHLGIPKSNFQTFEEKIFLKWLTTYQEIIIIIVTLHLLKYPIGVIEFDWSKKIGIDNPFPVLEIFEIQRISNLLPNDYMTAIKTIADKDKFTQDLYRHIENIPDMTQEEKELQSIDFDKSMIENGQGFLEWEKQQIEWMKKYYNEDENEILKRIEILRKWAIENNMMKPKIERLKDQGFFKDKSRKEES